MAIDESVEPLALLKSQRSHMLFVLSHPKAGHEASFIEWYQGVYRQSAMNLGTVLSASHYEQHEVDITQGHHARLPFRYLGIYEISVDGAEAAAGLIEQVILLHQQQPAAQAPATWLYYPASEKVGRPSTALPSMLTIAFANGVPGAEAVFREWYATRHIRHALNIPALVSGQCFERTQFQRPGAMEAKFSMIAVYEQDGTPKDIIESCASLPPETFHFPMLDLTRFAESVYRPV
jgi:hypothetical protein